MQVVQGIACNIGNGFQNILKNVTGQNKPDISRPSTLYDNKFVHSQSDLDSRSDPKGFDSNGRWNKDLSQVVKNYPLNESYRPSNSRQSSFDSNYSKFQDIQKEELGRAVWYFLHTVAANYPHQPTQEQKTNAKGLVKYVGRTYPCQTCAKDFRRMVKMDPPHLESKKDFEEWLCKVHNKVNVKLNKPVFNCQMVRSRWQELDCLNEEGEGSCAVRQVTKPK